MQVQYRNSIYIGLFDDYQRYGYGQLLFDNSHYVIGKWKGNKVNGLYTLISDNVRAFGTMNNNKLEGYSVLSMRESAISNKPEQERTIYGMFRDNKLYGKALIIQKQETILGHFVSGELREITDRKPLKQRDVYEMLRAYFPNQPYSIEQSLNQIFQQASKDFPYDTFPKYQPKVEVMKDGLNLFGYSEINALNKWIGIATFKGEVITVGEHEQHFLEGLGRMYKEDVVEDGVFKKGAMNGIGIKYIRNGHKYILGEHGSKNDQFEKGFGFPHKQVTEIRKQFHLRSIHFYNDIVLLSFTTLFEAILQSSSQLTYEQSPRFTIPEQNRMNKSRSKGFSEKSPIRSRLARYSEESDHIDEPSPIKNKPTNNQYQMIGGSRKYFESQADEDEQIYGNPHRQQKQQHRDYDDDRSNKSKNKSKGSRKVKDTKQLVKQLDAKERTRRDFLQKIYEEAGLTSHKQKSRH